MIIPDNIQWKGHINYMKVLGIVRENDDYAYLITPTIFKFVITEKFGNIDNPQMFVFSVGYPATDTIFDNTTQIVYRKFDNLFQRSWLKKSMELYESK